MRRIYDELISRVALPVAARLAGTATGTTIDRTDPAGGTDSTTSALLVVLAGTITDGSHAVTVQVSDDGSSWSTAPAEHLQGSPPTITSTDDDRLFEVGYTGPRRYLRITVATSGATTGGVFGAVVILGGAGQVPVQR
ncbi:hypothetical protein ACWCHM_26115 [Micromonospora sp. SCSIO 07396]